MNKFEEFNVYFKIISNENKNIYFEGYVTINDENGEDVDWYFWNGNGYQSRYFCHYDSVKLTPTDKQNIEIDNFINNYLNDALWIDDCILNCNENEHRTYVRENCTIVLNDGAKMECEIEEFDGWDNMGYFVKVIPKFNGRYINLMEYMDSMGEQFDPYALEDDSSFIENGNICFEMSKDYWDDEESRNMNMELINEEARRIYARVLSYELGIYSKYGEVIEQMVDDYYDDEYLFELSQLLNVTEEELDIWVSNLLG